jgi:hypothetical protein
MSLFDPQQRWPERVMLVSGLVTPLLWRAGAKILSHVLFATQLSDFSPSRSSKPMMRSITSKIRKGLRTNSA